MLPASLKPTRLRVHSPYSDACYVLCLCLCMPAVTLGESASVSFFVERRLWSASQHDIDRGAEEGEWWCICSICLDQVGADAQNEEEAVVTACGHIFHAKCCKQVLGPNLARNFENSMSCEYGHRLWRCLAGVWEKRINR